MLGYRLHRDEGGGGTLVGEQAARSPLTSRSTQHSYVLQHQALPSDGKLSLAN